MRKKYWVIIAIMFVSGLFFWLPGLTALDFELRAGLATLVFAGSLFVLEPIAIQVTALLIPIALVATNLLTVEEAFAPFADPVVFLILGSLFIAEALRKHNLTRKLATQLLFYSRGRPRLILLSIMVVGALTSMWVFSTAVVAMLIPVCLTIGGRVQEPEHRDDFTRVLLMALALATTLGGLSTILGAASNAVASGVLADEITWTFLDWMFYGTPLSFVLISFSWFILASTVLPTDVTIETEHLYPRDDDKPIFTQKQLITLATFLGAILLWLTSPILTRTLPLTRGLLESSVISLIAANFLFTFEVISWKDARRVNWGVYLIIGGGLALGNGLVVSGVAREFALLTKDLLAFFPYPIVAALLVFFSSLASNSVNNTTVVAIFAPLLLGLSADLPYSALQLVLPMAFGATFGFLLPCASSRMALIYTTNVISSKTMLKIGSLVTIPLIILTIVYFYLLFYLGWL